MSAYDHDPRVTGWTVSTPSSTYTIHSAEVVDPDGVPASVEWFVRRASGGFVERVPVGGWENAYPTADEAIRSLIGDPE